MAQKRYRVRSGSIDVWINADSYTDAVRKTFVGVESTSQLGPDIGPSVVVLLEGDDEKLSVKFDLAKYYDEGPQKLPEADFSTPEFVWHQSSESYFVCEKNGYNLEVVEIDNEEWLYRVSTLFKERMRGVCRSKMQAVGRCEGVLLLAATEVRLAT